eukprot:964217-Prorocentrum_minimum.AAC.4
MCPTQAGHVAYIPQETSFFSCLTVLETLQFANSFQSASPEAVERVLHTLSLAACSATKVGGDSGGVNIPGISGGERRRLAIGCDLLTDSSIGCIVADEPTSGLDVFQVKRIPTPRDSFMSSFMSSFTPSRHQFNLRVKVKTSEAPRVRTGG